ncbi:MAG: Ig-like domain-containing protein, partial [Mycobacterium sp.]
MTSPPACRRGAGVIVALGLGAAVSASLPATAAALPVDHTPGQSANTDQAVPAQPGRAGVALGAPARQPARAAAIRAARRTPSAPAANDTAPTGHAGISRRAPVPPARTSAAQSSGLLGQLAVLLNNQTPRMSPTQTAQSPAGVVTGALNAVDPDSPQLRFTVTAEPDRGSAAVTADGTWTYTPDPALAATGVTDTFEVQVSDAPSGFAIHGLPGLLHLLS